MTTLRPRGHPLRVLLVRPRPDPETIGLQHVMLVEPLELEVLGGICRREGHQVRVVDLTLEQEGLDAFLAREKPDVLGVTGYITNVPAMIDACHRARVRDDRVVTVVGGVHCEVVPGDLDHPDVQFRVVRNAVSVWPRLLRLVAEGAGEVPPGVLQPGESADLARLPPFDFAWSLPDRSLTRHYQDRYFYIFHDRVALLKTSFGCPYRCTFCFCRRITGDRYRERPLEEVLDELQGIDQQEVYIVDDDFLVTADRVRAFIAGVRSRGLRKHYLVYGRADFIAQNPEVIREFREAGLRTVIVGFESFLDRDLDLFRKGTSSGVNEEAMAVLNRHGVECYATMILPASWGREEFQRCGERLRALGVRFVNLQPLTPLPGTGIEVDPDRLLVPRSDFPRWDLAHVMIRPERLTEAEFYEELIRLYWRVLFHPQALWAHRRRSPRMIWKMIRGTALVDRQYRKKLAEARARCRD